MNRIRLTAIVLAILGGAELLQVHAAKLELRPTLQNPPGAAAAPAQESAGTPQAPVFRAGVELVRLDVRVLDANGQPIKDLKPDEVTIEEGGRKRSIVLFQHVAEPAGTYIEAARQTIGAEVSTNQGAPRGHLYVFVFDQGHITPGNEQRARAAVEGFLRTRVRPGDKVALYAIPGPGPQLGFSSNVSLALAELPKVRGSLERQVGVGVASMSLYEAYQIARGDQAIAQRVLARSTEATTALDVSGRAAAARAASGATGSPGAGSTGESITQALQLVTDASRTVVGTADSETRAFLYSLSDVIRELAAIEGRKSVVLVSEGFYADNVSRDVDRVAAAAAEAYAVVYSLDINRRGIDVSAAAPSGAEPASEIQSRVESLGALAAETSGELVLDSSGQMERVLTRIADGSQDYYLVGFEPPPGALVDRHTYRRVTVKVARPGARVSARTGYALRDPSNAADRRRSIDSALLAPFPQQGLPVEMTTYVLRGTSPGAQRVFMSLLAELPVANGSKASAADVVFVVRRADEARVMASGTDVMALPSGADTGRTTAPGRFNVQFDLPAGEYLMRAVVREPGGTAGTVDRRFEVRALDGVDATASDLIIGRRQDRLPVRPVSYVEEGLAGAMEVYARRPSDLDDADVTVDLFRVGSDSPVRSVKAELGDVRSILGRCRAGGDHRDAALRRGAGRLRREGDTSRARGNDHRGDAPGAGAARPRPGRPRSARGTGDAADGHHRRTGTALRRPHQGIVERRGRRQGARRSVAGVVGPGAHRPARGGRQPRGGRPWAPRPRALRARPLARSGRRDGACLRARSAVASDAVLPRVDPRRFGTGARRNLGLAEGGRD